MLARVLSCGCVHNFFLLFLHQQLDKIVLSNESLECSAIKQSDAQRADDGADTMVLKKMVCLLLLLQLQRDRKPKPQNDVPASSCHQQICFYSSM